VADWSWCSPPEPVVRRSIPRGGGGCLFFTTSMGVFSEINKYQRKNVELRFLQTWNRLSNIYEVHLVNVVELPLEKDTLSLVAN